MNRNRGQVSWISLVMLIGLLLFKGVAAAAMLCCGPEHSAHVGHPSAHSQQLVTENSVMATHSHHSSEESAAHHAEHHTQMMAVQDAQGQPQTELQADAHQISCSGCAVGCTAAVLMINPSELLTEKVQTERITSFTLLQISLTSSGLERPPRLNS